MKLRRWSHSTVDNLLGGCPYAVYLDKFVGLPRGTSAAAEIGTAYHAAIEQHEEARRLWWYTGGQQGDRQGIPFDDMLDVADERLGGCGLELTDEDREKLHAALNNWWHVPIPEGQPGGGGSLRDRVLGWRPLRVEAHTKVWRPDVTARPIVGYIDGVYYDPAVDEIVVVDQKSASKLDRFPLDGNGKRPQATFYMRAALDDPSLPALPSGPARRFEYHVARTEQSDHARFQAVRVVTIHVDQLDVTQQDKTIRVADRMVAEGRFDKNPSWFLCSPKWCAHHQDAGGTCDPHGPPEYPIDVVGEPLPVVS